MKTIGIKFNYKKALLCIIIIFFYGGVQAQWVTTGGPSTSKSIQCLTVIDSTVLAGTNGGLVRSTNNGITWSNVGGGLPFSDIRSLFFMEYGNYPFNLLAGMINGRISSSSNLGTTFTAFPDITVQPGGLAHVNALLKLKDYNAFWAGTDLGIFRLSEFYPLSTWIAHNDGFAAGGYTKVRALIVKDTMIYAGTDHGIYKVSPTSSVWTEKNNLLTDLDINRLATANGTLVATSRNNLVFTSSDNGENWVFSKEIPSIQALVTIGGNIIVGSYGDGVWVSNDYGANWHQENTGFLGAAYYVLSLGVNNDYIFAGTNNANVWRRHLSDIISITTENKENSLKSLNQPALVQNYPNPFSGNTTIAFELPSSAHVTLKIYNLQGQEILKLLDENYVAGKHTVQWNADNYECGVYYCKMKVGNYIETKKLVLIK